MKLEKSDLQLESIVSRIRDGEVDLQPDFQRGEVWDMKRKQRLVDTILRDWYVPAVHVVIDDDQNEVVLDGQQRLATIRGFFDDEIRVDGNLDPKNDKIKALHGRLFSELPDSVQRAVRRFVLPVITLSQYLPEEPSELFFRLNQSYNLTPPEKRNALHGTARNQVRELVEHLTTLGLLNSRSIGFSNGRLAYDDVVSRTCVALELGDLQRHINNNVVEEFYRTSKFTDATLGGVAEAGSLLLDQLQGGRVKFNKGTLQSWLTYCCWAPRLTGQVPGSLLLAFEQQRLEIRHGSASDPDGRQPAREVVAVYDDRASYRVTDVSSVVLRDLAIHLFSVAEFGTPDLDSASQILIGIGRRPGDRSQAQALMTAYWETIGWGRHIAHA